MGRRIKASPELSKEEWTRLHERNVEEYVKPDAKEGFDEIISEYLKK